MGRLTPVGHAGELTAGQSRLVPRPMHEPRRTRRSAMHPSSTLDSGLDVHKDSLAGAYVTQEHGAEVAYLGTTGTRQCDIEQLLHRLHSRATYRGFGHEAGLYGSWRYRYLTKTGPDGWVVASS